MTLRDYLSREGIAINDFADDLPAARTTIRKIVYATRQPSLPLAVRITAATKGEVSHADLIRQRIA